eukprot:405703_1
MALYNDSQAHPNPNDDSVLYVVQRGPPCLQLEGLCRRTNVLSPKATSRRRTRRKPESTTSVAEEILQDDNGNFDCNVHTIQEFTVSYCNDRRRSSFQISKIPYFCCMRTPASIVPALFVILGIVLPIGILATVYIVSLKATAIAGIVIIIALIRMNHRRVIEETVIIVPGLGISIQKRLQSGVLHNSDFIHVSSMEAVVIHEGFFHGRVVYFLAIVVKGRDELVIMFKNFLPRLEILKPVYKKLREHLPLI